MLNQIIDGDNAHDFLKCRSELLACSRLIVGRRCLCDQGRAGQRATAPRRGLPPGLPVVALYSTAGVALDRGHGQLPAPAGAAATFLSPLVIILHRRGSPLVDLAAPSWRLLHEESDHRGRKESRGPWMSLSSFPRSCSRSRVFLFSPCPRPPPPPPAPAIYFFSGRAEGGGTEVIVAVLRPPDRPRIIYNNKPAMCRRQSHGTPADSLRWRASVGGRIASLPPCETTCPHQLPAWHCHLQRGTYPDAPPAPSLSSLSISLSL